MIDPFSTLAAVVGLIDVLGRTSAKLVSLISDWKQAPTIILALSNEAADLTIVLDRVRDAARAARGIDPERDAVLIAALDVQLSKARVCLAQLDDLLNTLNRGNKAAKRNRWLRKKSTALRLRDNLKEIRRNINEHIVVHTLSSSSRVELTLRSVQQSILQSQSVISEQLGASHEKIRDLTVGLHQIGNAIDVTRKTIGSVALESTQRDQRMLSALSTMRADHLSSIDSAMSRVANEFAAITSSLNVIPDPEDKAEIYPLLPSPVSRDVGRNYSIETVKFVLERQQSTCPPDCICRCHHSAPREFRLRQKSFLGSLFVGYCGSPVRNTACDLRRCAVQQRTYLKVAYIFPSWFLNFALYAFFEHSDAHGPAYGLAARRRIPWSVNLLFEAAYWGDLPKVRHILRNKEWSPNDICADTGRTALRVLIGGENFNLNVAQELIRAGADPFIADDNGLTAYDVAIMQLLMNYRNPANSKITDDIKMAFSISSNWLENIGLTYVHRVVLGICCTDIEKALSDPTRYSREDVDTVDETGKTPLDWAAVTDDVRAVQALLRIGAKIHVPLRAPRRISTIGCAISSPNGACFDTLFSAGADLNLRTNYLGSLPIHVAAELNRVSILRRLLSLGIDPGTRGFAGYTPLMYAARKDTLESVQLLLEYNADINQANHEGYTALLLAVKYNRHRCLQYFLQIAADYTVAKQNGETVLHVAAIWGNEVSLDMLTAAKLRGLDAGACNSAGETPRDLFYRRDTVPASLKSSFETFLESVVGNDCVEIQSDDEQEFFDASE